MHPWSKAHAEGCNDRAVCKVLNVKSLEILEAVKVRRSVKFHHDTIESVRVTKSDVGLGRLFGAFGETGFGRGRESAIFSFLAHAAQLPSVILAGAVAIRRLH